MKDLSMIVSVWTSVLIYSMEAPFYYGYSQFRILLCVLWKNFLWSTLSARDITVVWVTLWKLLLWFAVSVQDTILSNSMEASFVMLFLIEVKNITVVYSMEDPLMIYSLSSEYYLGLLYGRLTEGALWLGKWVGCLRPHTHRGLTATLFA